MPVKIGPINAATVTPLRPDGSFDAASAKRLAQRWVRLGLDGVMVIGSMGEGLLLDDETRNATVQAAVEHAGDKLTVFATVADTSRSRMIERARRYAGFGVACIVVCVPPKRAPAEAIDDVKAVADASPVPCAYYENPENTGTPLLLTQVLNILEHDNIVALKDSSGNALLAQALSSTQYRPRGIKLLHGVEYAVTWTRLLGYDGVLHGGGTLTGKHVRDIWDAVGHGDMKQAVERDRANSLCLGTIYHRFAPPLKNVLGQKYALKLLGVLDHAVTATNQQLDDNDRKRIEQAVEANRSWLEV